jgi:hypothetical protein
MIQVDPWGEALAWARKQRREQTQLDSRPALRTLLRYKATLFTTRRVGKAERGRR